MQVASKTMFVCAGTQSSGSTLISWCFLQRSDMNGVLDGDNDILPTVSSKIGRPHAWYKTTISSFRLSEMVAHFEDQGWRVRPLLVIRDVRAVWASLVKKPYGSNGMTAEDPPLRVRMRRFKDDWEIFRRRNWPILRYESLVDGPEATLRGTCEQLDLPWEEDMLSWPKRREEIADTRYGNPTFWRMRTANLLDTLREGSQVRRAPSLPAEDLAWLEEEFRGFNIENDYPTRLGAADAFRRATVAVIPFEKTRRYKWELRRRPVRWLMSIFGVRDRALVDCFYKRAV